MGLSGAWLACAVWASGVLLVVTMVGGAPVARAASGFAIERYSFTATEESGATDTQASSYPYAVTAEAVLEGAATTSSDELRSLTFKLPPGLMIDPRDVAVEAGAVGELELESEGAWSSAPLEKLSPPQGELDALGFTLHGILVPIAIKIAGGPGYTSEGGGYGMTLTIRNMPQQKIEAVKLVLGGTPPTFIALPTSCAISQSTVEGESWGGGLASQSTSLPPLSGCGEGPFEPALLVSAEALEAGEPSGYTISMKVPEPEYEPEGASTQLRDASITLPAGVSLSLSATNGLEDCTEAQFAPTTAAPQLCPNTSKVGTLELRVRSLAEPLQGGVFLAMPKANPLGSTVALYMVAEEPTSGTTIKLIGRLSLNPSTGQGTVVFEDLPQLPISEVSLRLFGGPRALLANPPICGTATTSALLEPWSGSPDEVVRSSFQVSEGADRAPCASPEPFTPKSSVQPTSVPAGGTSGLLLAISRKDDEQALSSFGIQLPAGVRWNATGSQSCGETAASEGTCPTSSEIGRAIAIVGPGSTPAWFEGPVYLTDAYRGGQSGLSIVLDATAGPFDLGELVLHVSIGSDPSTGTLQLSSDSLPQMIDGVPLRMKALEVEIEREGLILYPTICPTGQIVTTLESPDAARTQSATPFTVEGCGSAPVAPTTSELPGESPPSTSPPHHGPPRISGLSEAHRRWRIAGPLGKRAAGRRSIPVGTRFTFRLNEPAQVKLTFTRRLRGVRAQGHCSADSAGRQRNGRESCAVTIIHDSIERAGRAGHNRIFFSGELSRRHRLQPGAWTVTIVATTRAGTSRSKTLRFRVVR